MPHLGEYIEQIHKEQKNAIIEELENIKIEIKQMPNESWNDCDTVDRKELLNRIDKHIKELKGEQK